MEEKADVSEYPIAEAVQKPTARASRNSDGSVVVTLADPVKFNGETHAKVTIPALKGKQLRKAPFASGKVSVGELAEWAALIIEPLGIVDAMEIDDAMFCSVEVQKSWLKSS